jgi:hypothetical protein
MLCDLCLHFGCCLTRCHLPYQPTLIQCAVQSRVCSVKCGAVHAWLISGRDTFNGQCSFSPPPTSTSSSFSSSFCTGSPHLNQYRRRMRMRGCIPTYSTRHIKVNQNIEQFPVSAAQPVWFGPQISELCDTEWTAGKTLTE